MISIYLKTRNTHTNKVQTETDVKMNFSHVAKNEFYGGWFSVLFLSLNNFKLIAFIFKKYF